MNIIQRLFFINELKLVSAKKIIPGVFLVLIVSLLTACSKNEGKAGQVLVRVNGEEITMLQINDELVRAGVIPEQQELARKQLVESLIDRQLLIAEARRNKIDRQPEIVQAIERAKILIISQAYLKGVLSNTSKPTSTEINDYFHKHPDYFSQRKQYDLQQIIVATQDFNDELKLVIDSASSLEIVGVWLEKHNIKYARGKLTRNSSELPEQMLVRLKELKRGQLFIVNEGDRKLINAIGDIKSSPVPIIEAESEISQYLVNLKSKDAAEAEIAHLRSSAKIQYLNASAPVAP